MYINYFASLTSVLPKTHSDYIKKKLKHLEYCGWVMQRRSCKEVLKPSERNLAQLPGVPISYTTWECAPRVTQWGYPAKLMSYYATLLTVKRYSVVLPWTLSFTIVLFPSSEFQGYGTRWVCGCSAGRPSLKDIGFHHAKTTQCEKVVKNVLYEYIKQKISTEHCRTVF